MNKPTIGSYIKLLEISEKWGPNPGDVVLSDYPNGNIHINIKDLYFKVFAYDDYRIQISILSIDDNESILKGWEKITKIRFDGLITKREYYNPIDLTRVDLSRLDEDSLIPEDQYKIVA